MVFVLRIWQTLNKFISTDRISFVLCCLILSGRMACLLCPIASHLISSHLILTIVFMFNFHAIPHRRKRKLMCYLGLTSRDIVHFATTKLNVQQSAAQWFCSAWYNNADIWICQRKFLCQPPAGRVPCPYSWYWWIPQVAGVASLDSLSPHNVGDKMVRATGP